MPQTIISTANLGSRYLAGIQYRAFDSTGTALNNLNAGSHLGNGIWRAVVILPDQGGEVRWYANGGNTLLGVDPVNPLAQLEQNNAIDDIYGYTQALATGRFSINYGQSTATLYNRDGTPLQIFDLKDPNGQPATSAQSAVDRIPQGDPPDPPPPPDSSDVTLNFNFALPSSSLMIRYL